MNPTKKCSSCKEVKDRSKFARGRRSKDGLQPWCAECYLVYQRKHGKHFRELLKARHDADHYQLAHSESRSKRCPVCGQTKSVEEFCKRRARSDGFASCCKPCEIQRTNRSRRRRKYDIAPDKYDQLLLKQDGKCEICKRLPYTKKGLVVDHCHGTGVIRGILCSRCTSALGLLDDSPLLLERALMYLS
jgi:hypothetical protein